MMALSAEIFITDSLLGLSILDNVTKLGVSLGKVPKKLKKKISKYYGLVVIFQGYN
jgi:phage-related holin